MSLVIKDAKQENTPKLGKPYLVRKNKEISVTIPMIFSVDGFLGIDLTKIKRTDRNYVLNNINSLSFSSKKLTKYEYMNTKEFYQIDKKLWPQLESLSTKKG